MACNCCDGYCPECVELPNTPCCGHVAPVVPYKCVRPAPQNRSTQVIGNSYGADLFKVCPLPDNMFDAEQVVALRNTMFSMLSYFHGYSTLNVGNAHDSEPVMGREYDCTASWMGGVYPSATSTTGTPLTGGCESCDSDRSQLVYRSRWTQTLPSECCQIPVVDENGDPVLDGDGNPTTEPTMLMFGVVPESHAYLTQYGGTPSMPIDFDRIDPATSAKIAGLIEKVVCEIEKAAA